MMKNYAGGVLNKRGKGERGTSFTVIDINNNQCCDYFQNQVKIFKKKKQKEKLAILVA